MIEKKFLKAQSEFKLFQKDDNVLIAFSGGVDSTVLTHLILKFKKYLKLNKIYLAHLNHMLRGEDSLKDEQFCREFAEKHNLKIFIKRLDIKQLASKEKKSLEEVARKERYKFFEELRKEHDIQKIATGHHQTDLAETMILWFIQGNRNGLKGFKPKNRVVRPLYFIKKDEILEYAHKNNIEYVQDITNFQTDFLRNRIRLQVLPILREINPNLENSLQLLSRFLFIDDEYLENEANKLLLKIKNKQILNIDKLKNYPEAVIYRVMSLWIKEKTGIHLSYIKILQILKILKSSGNKEISLTKEYKLVKEYNNVFIKFEKDDEKKDILYKFKISDKEVVIPELNMKILIKKPEKVEDIRFDSPKVECFEIPDLKEDDFFVLRFRKRGDRFLPFGKRTEKKLKDVFIDMKIPKSMRENIPIIEFRNKILWIVGHKRSGYFPVKNKNLENVICFEIKEE